MKSQELGPEHSTHSVAWYASACGPSNPGHEIFFGVGGVVRGGFGGGRSKKIVENVL